MVDQRTGKFLNAPALGWRDVDIRTKLAAATGLSVHIENSGRASGLAQLWLASDAAIGEHNFAYISVADGVGTSVAVKGKLLRGAIRSQVGSDTCH
jgi:predicted NBD/HSP70 family sugar kinase